MSLAAIDDFYNFDLLNEDEKIDILKKQFYLFHHQKKILKIFNNIFCLISNRILIADFENITDY